MKNWENSGCMTSSAQGTASIVGFNFTLSFSRQMERDGGGGERERQFTRLRGAGVSVKWVQLKITGGCWVSCGNPFRDPRVWGGEADSI